MNSDLDSKPPRYRWPWLVAAGAGLFILLAVFWVALAARKIHEQRETEAPVGVSPR
jgi:hypothetical protein